MPEGNNSKFLSSQDGHGLNVSNIYWDYSGLYYIQDASENAYLKILTLDYDSYGNESFELHVINDELISLFHLQSGTTYQFEGKGLMQYDTFENSIKDSSKASKSNKKVKLRTQQTTQKENPRHNTRTI